MCFIKHLGTTTDHFLTIVVVHNYRPQTKLGKVMFAQACVCSQGEGVEYPSHWRGHIVGYTPPLPPGHGTWIPYLPCY